MNIGKAKEGTSLTVIIDFVDGAQITRSGILFCVRFDDVVELRSIDENFYIPFNQVSMMSIKTITDQDLV